MNHSLMREVATPILSPMAEHTPKAFHSIKSFMWYKLRMSFGAAKISKSGSITNKCQVICRLNIWSMANTIVTG